MSVIQASTRQLWRLFDQIKSCRRTIKSCPRPGGFRLRPCKMKGLVPSAYLTLLQALLQVRPPFYWQL